MSCFKPKQFVDDPGTPACGRWRSPLVIRVSRAPVVAVFAVLGSAWLLAQAPAPAPGGVGPLTIAMLLANTVRAAEARVPA